MTEMIQWITMHQKLILTIVFWLVQGMIFVVLFVTAHRVRLMKKEMDSVCAQVKSYLEIVLKNEEEDVQESQVAEWKKKQKDEEENRIITTVLREMFP